MKFAIIENGIVQNVIVAEQDFINKNFPNAINVDGIICGPEWLFIDGEFFPPVAENTEIAE